MEPGNQVNNYAPTFIKGTLVWIKDCKKWWPAIILDGAFTNQRSEEFCKVFLFGLNSTTMLKKNEILDFFSHFNDVLTAQAKVMGLLWKQTVTEILTEQYKDTRSFPTSEIEKMTSELLDIAPHRIKLIPEWVRAMLNCTEVPDDSGLDNTNTEKPSTSGRGTPRKRRFSTPFILPKRDTFSIGQIVWAKYSQYWWAAMIFSEDLNNSYNIIWLSDCTTSKLGINRVSDFKDNFQVVMKKSISKMGKSWKKGVVTALTELYENKIGFSAEDLPHLTYNGIQNIILYRENNVPDWIKTTIQNKRHEENQSKKKCPVNIKEILRLKIHWKEELDGSFCVACYTSVGLLSKHPLFHAHICPICLDRLKETLYVKGDDGLNYFCSVCGHGGQLIMCDKDTCGRGYCIGCVSDLSVEGTWQNLLKSTEWSCFLCEKNAHGVIIGRDDFNIRTHEMYYEAHKRQLVNTPSKPLPNGTKLRVVSLYDGISTGMYALQKLNLPIEIYYASEIDPVAINISKSNFGDRIKQLGDITKITEKTIKKISPIHLVIGGSPCNDLSLVNPVRKGLHDTKGTGCLFFEFVRILFLINKHNKNGIYWMFENVAAMELNSKRAISISLECEPVLKDAVEVSPQHRPRFFWGNIPTLLQPLPEKDCVLQDVLMPHRNAAVRKLRTITTNRHSLRQGKDAISPVMNKYNEEDTIWITELEKVFGLPAHYTDTANLSCRQRQQALGKAWSVPVIHHLFSFLQNFCPPLE